LAGFTFRQYVGAGLFKFDSDAGYGLCFVDARGEPAAWRTDSHHSGSTPVRLIDPRTGQLLREHSRQQRGRHRIQEQDRPSRTPLSTQQLLHRAEKAG
jgi:hypothetical protein